MMLYIERENQKKPYLKVIQSLGHLLDQTLFKTGTVIDNDRLTITHITSSNPHEYKATLTKIPPMVDKRIAA